MNRFHLNFAIYLDCLNKNVISQGPFEVANKFPGNEHFCPEHPTPLHFWVRWKTNKISVKWIGFSLCLFHQKSVQIIKMQNFSSVGIKSTMAKIITRILFLILFFYMIFYHVYLHGNVRLFCGVFICAFKCRDQFLGNFQARTLISFYSFDSTENFW